jgi:predicted ArsR family transcriptional regulator
VADLERRSGAPTPARAVEVHRPPDAGTSLERLLALGDSTRRDLYFFVVGRGTWVSRKEAAEALELRPGLVAHHLDRLVDDGLLEIEYRRLTGRSGPGAGRPAKLYRRTDATFELTLPPRNPRLVNQLLIEAVGRLGRRADPVRQALADVAREAGVAAGRRAADGAAPVERGRAFTDLLGAMGYAPHTGDAELSLANCPYEPVAEQDRTTVCSMNLALVEGAAAGVGLRRISCSLRPPVGGGCCVHVAPWPNAG